MQPAQLRRILHITFVSLGLAVTGWSYAADDKQTGPNVNPDIPRLPGKSPAIGGPGHDGGDANPDAARPGRVAHSAADARAVVHVMAPSGPTSCPPGPWRTSTLGPSARYRAGAVTDGTHVFVFGGGDQFGQYLNDLWRWDASTETWMQLANMPTGKQNIQGAYWNGKIYVPGGYIGNHITENAIYNIATNTWTLGAPLPAQQTGQQVAFNGKIYNFGGNPGPQNTVTIYDIATNSWSNGAPMPAAVTYGRATVAGNFAYYVGGISGVGLDTVYRYDFAANSWATMSPLQTARTSEELMASPDGSKLFAVMGGGDQDFFTGVPLPHSVEIYDVAANSWSYGFPVVTKAAAPAGGLAGAKVMVQGGTDNNNFYDAVQISDLPSAPCPTPPPVIANYAVTMSDGASIVPGTTDTGNHCDKCTTQISLPFSFQLYDQTFTTAYVSANGVLEFIDNGSACCGGCLPGFFSYAISAGWSDLDTSDESSGSGIFTSVSGTAPNRIFNIEWRARYCCGGSAPPTEHFEMRLHESDNRIEFVYGPLSPKGFGFGIGVQGKTTCDFKSISCNETPPMGRHYTLTPSFQALPDYAVTTSSGASVVPGTDDIDNHCHDCETPVTLPFPVQFYDQTFTSATVSSNGFLQFNGNGFDQGGSCIPNSSFNNVIAAHWSHLYTTDTASGQGIFTSVSGTAPNRIFNIEWRARYCCVNGPPTENFEIRLYESQNRVDLVYGATQLALNDPSGIDFGIGVQREAGQCQYTALSCGTAPLPGTRYTLTIPSAVAVTGAVSRKTHGGAGAFDIPMPLTGTSGVECRTTGGTNDYTLAVSFSDNVNVTGTPQAQVTSGTGCVGSSGTCTGNVSFSGNSVTVPLTNVANGQVINIRLNGVNGIDFNIPMGILVGDTNGNRTVNASDVSQTKARTGQVVDATNFHSDVNANGAINASDVSLVKSRSGTALP